MLIKIGLFIADTYREQATELWLHIPNLASEVPHSASSTLLKSQIWIKLYLPYNFGHYRGSCAPLSLPVWNCHGHGMEKRDLMEKRSWKLKKDFQDLTAMTLPVTEHRVKA